MLKIIVLGVALTLGTVMASPVPDPLAPSIPGAAVTTTHHHSSTATAAHHHVGFGGYGAGAGYGFATYPVVKHTETVSSAGYQAVNPYSGYGYPGLSGLGYGAYGGYPAAKQFTQVTTTAVRPGYYGYY